MVGDLSSNCLRDAARQQAIVLPFVIGYRLTLDLANLCSLRTFVQSTNITQEGRGLLYIHMGQCSE